MFKFKDVDVTFDMKKLPSYDQEYLKSMTYEMVQATSVLHTGKTFNQLYPHADNFMLFNNFTVMANSMNEFSGQWHCYPSHLLDGKKYWFAWTYQNKE